MKRLHNDYDRRFHIHYAVCSLPFIVMGIPIYLKNQYTCSSYIAKLLQENGIAICQKAFLPMNENRRQKWGLHICIFISIMALTFWSVFRNQDFMEMTVSIQGLFMQSMAMEVLLAVFIVAGEGCMIWYLLKGIGERAGLLRCISYSFIGFFFSGITPSATGGQPMQLYCFRVLRVPEVIVMELEKRRCLIEIYKEKMQENFIDNDYISCQANGKVHSLSAMNIALKKLCVRNGLPAVTVHGLRICLPLF